MLLGKVMEPRCQEHVPDSEPFGKVLDDAGVRFLQAQLLAITIIIILVNDEADPFLQGSCGLVDPLGLYFFEIDILPSLDRLQILLVDRRQRKGVMGEQIVRCNMKIITIVTVT